MTTANPPPERDTINHDDAARHIVDCFADMVRRARSKFRRQQALHEFGSQITRARAAEVEAEAIALDTARLIDRFEPDANRRAAIWLIGRQWIDKPCDSSDPRTGARAMQRWVRALLAQPRC